jgi:glycosyltransferase involved in cell wall biosynthesis
MIFTEIMEKEGKKTIAFFLPSLDVGGAEKNVINFVKGIDKEKYQIKIILGEKRGYFLNDPALNGVSIAGLGTQSLFKIFSELKKYFKKDAPDIFVSTFPRFNLVNLLAKLFSKNNFKFVVIEQTTPSKLSGTAKKLSHRLIARFFLRPLLKFFYPKADAIVCVSEGVKKDICSIIGALDTIRVIYNPVVEEKIFEQMQEKTNYAGFNNKAIPVIVSAGRLVKAKDFPTLLSAFALVLKEKPARLLILGEGEEKENLKKICRNINIQDSVDFLEFQSNPYKYFSKASVFAASSLREGFSNIIVEAMACGLPVVSTNSTGPKEIINNGKNGILVPAGDSISLAKGILSVLNNLDLSKRLSEEGKIRAQDFTIEKSIREYEKLFQELLVL